MLNDYYNEQQCLQAELTIENAKYNDILQGTFMEHYNLLVKKSFLVLSWSKRRCGHVPWIVKTDDDVVFHLDVLSRDLHQANREKISINEQIIIMV